MMMIRERFKIKKEKKTTKKIVKVGRCKPKILKFLFSSFSFLFPQHTLNRQVAALYPPSSLTDWLTDCSELHNLFQQSLHILGQHSIQNLCQTRPNQLDFTIPTKFHNFDQISQFRQNFTILPKFHNFVQISQFWPNFTILTKFHNFGWFRQCRQYKQCRQCRRCQ